MVNQSNLRRYGRLLAVQLHAPLYIPPEGRSVLKHLEAAGPSGLIQELQRLSALGSAWASAALDHIYLRPGPTAKPNPNRAIELCQNHAERGDSYAQYIYAWALLHLGQRNMAVRAMQSSAISRFPPAAMDFVIFVWHGWGMKQRDPRAARKLLRVAFKLHHAMALKWLCRLNRSGEYGIWRRVLGFMLTPFAHIRYAFAIWADPFAALVLTLSMNTSPLHLEHAP
jgi:hypothetical protein